MSSEREKKIAESIAQNTRKALKNLPSDAKFVRGSQVLGKKELIQRFDEDDDFAADMTGNVAATMLEHAVRKESEKLKKKDKKPT